MTTQARTFQEVVNDFPPTGSKEHEEILSTLWPFTYTDGETTYILGYITPAVASALRSLPPALGSHLDIKPATQTISLTATTRESRTAALAAIVTHWKNNQTFAILQKWRGEETPIYAPTGVIWATIERSATPIFGLSSYYVNLIAYTMVDGEMKMWVQRRASSKASHGGMLDATVAGAIMAGSDPVESMEREAEEEASFSQEIVKRAKPCVYASTGTNRLLNMNIVKSSGTEESYCRPGCGFGFEVELREGEEPRPNDGEVEGFYCLGMMELKERLEKGEFMPNAAKVLVEWLVAKGVIDGVEMPVRELMFPVM